MRLWALIGIIAVLLLPFSIVQINIGDNVSSTSSFGLLWLSTEGEAFGFQSSDSETFNLDWIDDGGVYHSGSYFGDLWYFGLVLVVLLIVGAALAVLSDQNKSVPALILLICGILLLVLRLVELNDNDSSFYDSSEFFGITTTYLEVPLGFIISLIFSILDLRSD
jgi:hypothetical protein